jgi:hypothetical protein
MSEILKCLFVATKIERSDRSKRNLITSKNEMIGILKIKSWQRSREISPLRQEYDHSNIGANFIMFEWFWQWTFLLFYKWQNMSVKAIIVKYNQFLVTYCLLIYKRLNFFIKHKIAYLPGIKV